MADGSLLAAICDLLVQECFLAIKFGTSKKSSSQTVMCDVQEL